MIENYIALDLETTGLHPSEDRILEIGAVKVVNGEITDRYETLVNPGMAISHRIQALTGINDAMAATGKDTKTAVTELIDFCGDLPLLGHNILFDYSFVKKNAVNLGLTFEKDGVDTLKIARALLPDLEHKNLPYLCGYYQITQERAHRASDDACAAMELYRRLAAEFPDSPEELFAPDVYKRQGTDKMEKSLSTHFPEKAGKRRQKRGGIDYETIQRNGYELCSLQCPRGKSGE